MDIFTTKTIYPKLLEIAVDAGFATELLDEHWIAKIHKDRYLTDIIFAEKNAHEKQCLMIFIREFFSYNNFTIRY